MDINEFYSQLMLDASENAELEEISVEEALTDTIIEYIKEANETGSPELLLVDSSKEDAHIPGGAFKLNAYDYSDVEGVLDLFVSCFKEGDTSEVLQHNQIDSAFSKLYRFFLLSIEGKISEYYKDKRNDVLEFAEFLRSEYNSKNIHLIRFFVLSNSRLREDWALDDQQISDQQIEAEYHVWDLISVQRAEESGRELNEMSITLERPIECVKVEEINDKVTTYLGIMSAEELARQYDLHKQRLINQNVRNYLGGKIKVNAQIAKTLQNEPEMFLSYNNGISTVAADVNLEVHNGNAEDGGRLFIVGFRNWNIVNGGQTTCTIYNSFKKKINISKAYVSIKVSVIKDKDVNSSVVQSIAQYANSQTKINESDLNANSDYLMQIDKVSKLERTPKEAKVNKDTFWYFERLRGQLLSERFNVGAPGSAKVRKFMAERPKEQILSKTDIAKVIMAWDGCPHEASKGSEVCFNNFWRQSYKNDEVTREYFHDIVAKRILYLTIHKLFKDAGHSGYANIVDNYVLATIAYKTQKKLDLDYIWQTQEVQPELIETIKECIEIMVQQIANESNKGVNPSVTAKKIDFWFDVKNLMNGVKFPTGGSVIKKNSSALTPEQIAVIDEAIQLPIESWTKLSQWGKATHKLSIMEKKRIDHIIVAINKAPESISFTAADNCLRILRMAKDAGFEL